ncbi:MAG: prephenate dehydratase domain-containing protein [Eubacteriales bacterium]|nr:prephenate dehydratase domain-containing protein [Eubacteriales bacterium]
MKDPVQAAQPSAALPDLGYLRQRINAIDSQLLALFAERMELARDVARTKAISGAAVFDPLREDQIAASARDAVKGADGIRAEKLLRSLMRLSRGVQYDLLLPHDRNFGLGQQMAAAHTVEPAVSRIIHQGSAASYSGKACAILFPGQPVRSVQTFAEACLLVARKEADVAVLPLENSTAGSVGDVYQLLQSHGLFIWRSYDLPVHHHLMAVPGATLKQIHTVISHPQALAQCSDFIRRQGWHTIESLNTAFAAAQIAQEGDPSRAAIASLDAARTSHLHVLADDISNSRENLTRFVVVGRELVITPAANRLSLVLKTPHASGSLAATLALFSDRNLNLSKIHSRANPEEPWSYLFDLDVDCPANDPQALATLYQLSREMSYLQLLGWYPAETGNQPAGDD